MKNFTTRFRSLLIGAILISLVVPVNTGAAIPANNSRTTKAKYRRSVAKYRHTLKRSLKRYIVKVGRTKAKYARYVAKYSRSLKRRKRHAEKLRKIKAKYARYVAKYRPSSKQRKRYMVKLNRAHSKYAKAVAATHRMLKQRNKYIAKLRRAKAKYAKAKRYQKTFGRLIRKYILARRKHSRKTRYYQKLLKRYDGSIKRFIKNTAKRIYRKTLGLVVGERPRELVPALEKKTNYKFGSYQRFQSSTQNFDRKLADWLHSRNKTMEIAWMPRDPSIHSINQPAYRLSTIIRGDHDGTIRRWARQLKDFSHLIYFRPMPEMNDKKTWAGNANGNSPSQFKPAWRRVYNIFKQEGATNVKFVWCPNRDSSYKNAEATFKTYHPGDQYVDYNGFDGYNFGTIYSGSRWRDIDEVLKYSYSTFTRLSSKPIVISEIASTERGGNKAAWTKDFLLKLKYSYPKIKIVYWFNINKQTDFRIQSSKANLNAFKAYSK